MHGEAGKGDKPRPKSISEKDYARKYEEAFGKRIPWWATEEHQEWVKEMLEEQKKHKDDTD